MTITLKLFASLRKFLPEGAKAGVAEIEVPDGSNLAQLIEQFQLPHAMCHLTMLNGAHQKDWETQLEPGVEVSIFPPVAGGALAEEDILNALRNIIDPDLHRDIVALGFIKRVDIAPHNGGVKVATTIELTTPACPVKKQMEDQARSLIGALPGVSAVEVEMTAQVRQSMTTVKTAIAGVKNTIAVASGKGGVGKSTVSTNLALALADTGAVVGLMDADVYGPSIPIMLNAYERPNASPEGKILPIERQGLKLMSIGFIAGESTPVIWRGPMVGKLVQEFLRNVQWGELDYLIIDLPPGTGDAQLTLIQSAPLSGAVIVTTPQQVALEDVSRGIKMFQTDTLNVPILGLIENMSYFVCPQCDHKEHIFLSGGGRRAAEKYGVKYLGEIPLDAAICEAGDAGVPIVRRAPESSVAHAFRAAAGQIAAELSRLAFLQPPPRNLDADDDFKLL